MNTIIHTVCKETEVKINVIGFVYLFVFNFHSFIHSKGFILYMILSLRAHIGKNAKTLT